MNEADVNAVSAATAYALGTLDAVRLEVAAAVLEARCAAILEALGVPVRDAREIVEWARHEVSCDRPELSALERRAIVAARVMTLVAVRVQREAMGGAA